jgi:hypothetical protein
METNVPHPSPSDNSHLLKFINSVVLTALSAMYGAAWTTLVGANTGARLLSTNIFREEMIYDMQISAVTMGAVGMLSIPYQYYPDSPPFEHILFNHHIISLHLFMEVPVILPLIVNWMTRDDDFPERGALALGGAISQLFMLGLIYLIVKLGFKNGMLLALLDYAADLILPSVIDDENYHAHLAYHEQHGHIGCNHQIYRHQNPESYYDALMRRSSAVVRELHDTFNFRVLINNPSAVVRPFNLAHPRSFIRNIDSAILRPLRCLTETAYGIRSDFRIHYLLNRINRTDNRTQEELQDYAARLHARYAEMNRVFHNQRVILSQQAKAFTHNHLIKDIHQMESLATIVKMVSDVMEEVMQEARNPQILIPTAVTPVAAEPQVNSKTVTILKRSIIEVKPTVEQSNKVAALAKPHLESSVVRRQKELRRRKPHTHKLSGQSPKTNSAPPTVSLQPQSNTSRLKAMPRLKLADLLPNIVASRSVDGIERLGNKRSISEDKPSLKLSDLLINTASTQSLERADTPSTASSSSSEEKPRLRLSDFQSKTTFFQPAESVGPPSVATSAQVELTGSVIPFTTQTSAPVNLVESVKTENNENCFRVQLNPFETMVFELINMLVSNKDHGFKTFIVGGWAYDKVRERDQGIPPCLYNDIDLVTEIPPYILSGIFKKVPEVKGLFCGTLQGIKIDVVYVRDLSNLLDDANKRDFMLFYIDKEGRVYDPTNHSLAYLRLGLLYGPKLPEVMFKEDPLVILRAIYEGTKRNLNYDDLKRLMVADCTALIPRTENLNGEPETIVNPRRMNLRITKLFSQHFAGVNFGIMAELGLLQVLFPNIFLGILGALDWVQPQMANAAVVSEPSLTLIYATLIAPSIIHKNPALPYASNQNRSVRDPDILRLVDEVGNGSLLFKDAFKTPYEMYDELRWPLEAYYQYYIDKILAAASAPVVHAGMRMG